MAEQKILAERQRVLQSVLFQENVVASRDLPRDTCLKFIQMRINGAVVTTFGSGTPVCDFKGILNLIRRIDVIVDGNRTIKSLDPIFLRYQQMMFQKIAGEKRSSAGAAAVFNPTIDANFTYGTTGQYSTAVESITLPFECAVAGEGKENTWLNLKQRSSAELRLSFGAFANLLGFGNTAPVVFSSSTITVDITTIEQQNVPAEIALSDFRQTQKQEAFSSQTSDRFVEINRGNMLIGLMMLARDGAAGSATTATGKVPSNNLIGKLEVRVNGMTPIKSTTFQQLQGENRSRLGISSPMVSNISSLDGVAYMDMLVAGTDGKGVLSSALDLRPPLVDQCHLVVSTNSASAPTSIDYTNPCTLDILTNELVFPR